MQNVDKKHSQSKKTHNRDDRKAKYNAQQRVQRRERKHGWSVDY